MSREFGQSERWGNGRGEGILFLFFFYYLNSGQGGIQIFTFISISTLFAMIK